ncbi:MAG: FapA family protein [Pseudomonadota bacterium]
MEDSEIVTPGLTFSLNPESGELRVSFQPAADVSAPELAQLQAALQKSAYANFQFNDAALADFVAQAQLTSTPISLLIGMRSDAEIQLEVADNLMTAHLTLLRAHGGQAVQVKHILEALQQKGIIFGILLEQISTAVMAGECDHLLIASGQRMEAGTAGYFENLLLKKEQQMLQADENAVVRYSDLSHLLLVKKGDPLLRRIPPLPSSDGTNIKGQLVVAPMVPRIEFAEITPGAERDPNDPNLLVAACAGQPVITRNGALVNAILEVDNVCLKTGNIAFDGTIRVKGDVEAGMRVKVSGDVIVLGMVETAEIIAGGNVAIKGGMIGRANLKPGVHALPADAARIDCVGSVQAMFIENVRIKVGDSIVIDGHARNCELIARNQITVGKPGTKNSHLAGGSAQATQLVKVLNLGTSNGLKTIVQVGSDPDLVQEMAAKDGLLQRKMNELDQTLKLIAHFKQNPQKNVAGIGDKIEATRKQQASDIFALIEDKKELTAKFELTQQAQIEVTESLFEGVEIRIGKHVLKINDKRGASIIHLVDEHIVFD